MDMKYKNLMFPSSSISALIASQETIAEKYKNLMSPSSSISALIATQDTIAEKYKNLMSPSSSISALIATQDTIADKYKNLMFPSSSISALSASQDTIAEKYKNLMFPSSSISALIATQDTISEKYKNLMFPSSSISALIASQDTIAEKYKNLMSPSSSISALIASQETIAEKYKNLMFPSSSISALIATQDTIAEKYKNLMFPSSSISALIATQDTIAEKYKNLMSPSSLINALVRPRTSGEGELNSIKVLYNSVNSYLDNISAEELNSIVNVANIYTSTAEGAAYIAQSTQDFNEIEPDAITKLQEFKDKSSYVKKFRELPIVIQLIVYYFIMHIIFPIAEDKIKAEALELFNKSGDLIIQSLSINSYIKELVSNKNETVNWEVLKDFRVITADSVRLRDKPSMQGEVIETIKKYSVVAVLDKSNKKWLYVKISLNGEQTTGWVNRIYTKPLNKY
ncbi:hypothetical protein KP24_13690 [Pectobacterium atrosepticum]|uniref:SH3 domain-containing protein n=1 Tax=Pectobacterium atrosepticum TaxID=29471 RepID=UPI0005030438|nr:SH3 domain-containing protein [Pectobacterium atrosepticum]KFX23484.1 hypothetical protein KP24_13690 [Pectobacterium atrosepticum]